MNGIFLKKEYIHNLPKKKNLDVKKFVKHFAKNALDLIYLYNNPFKTLSS
jgi:hypothetical protein